MSTGRAIKDRAMPLCELPAEMQSRIADAVAAEKPPASSIDLGRAVIPSRAWFEWHWARGIFPTGSMRERGVKHRLRVQVIARDGLTCGLCGGEVEPDDVHIDHIHPRSLGGSDDLDNLQVSHSLCNMRKGNRV